MLHILMVGNLLFGQDTDFVMLRFISLKVPVKLHKDLVGSDVIVQKYSDDTSRNVRYVKNLVKL